MQSFNGNNYSKTGRSRYWYKTRWQDRSPMHRDVWEFFHGPLQPGYAVHHIDHNPDNNDIGNLLALTRSEHSRHHGRLRTTIPVAALLAAADWHRSEPGRAWHQAHGQRAYAARTLVQYVCKRCGKAFQSRARGRVYFCTDRCRARDLRARRRTDGTQGARV